MMKLNRTYWFVLLSSIALLTVLCIQISWILQTAKIKEELFNERANMVLSRTADALLSDKKTYRNIAAANMILSKKVNAQASVYYKTDTNLSSLVNEDDTRKIDSLFNYYMKLYNIHIDYLFEVKPMVINLTNEIPWQKSDTKKALTSDKKETDSYQTCIGDGADKNSLELKLVFPGKEKFILAEMSIPFFTSIVLLLVVIVLSWRTILSLVNEKRISENTTDFLNNMTHEFKTPLTNIALAGQMMQKDLNANNGSKAKYYSEIILEENEKLRLQVEQVLSMTALERGEIPLHKTELDIHQLIQLVAKNMSVQIENVHGYLRLNLDANDIVVMGDKTHLINAFCNLVDNAIKYSNGIPEIVIQTSNTNQYLVIAFSDNGIGIEHAYHKKVFDKFFRVPTGNLHNAKGFGLGLAYIQKIVELHKGIIDLSSEKGKGTTITIRLPNA